MTKTELGTINGKAIDTTKGAAREYGRIGCNFYKGCPHGCTYCYLKRGAPSAQLGGSVAELKKCLVNEDRALEIFCDEARKHIDALQRYGLFFSFTTDPLIPETRDLTLSALNFTMYNGIPVKVLTKDATFIDYQRVKNNLLSDAAKKFVDFVLSQESQEAVCAQLNLRPCRDGISVNEKMVPDSEITMFPTDSAKYIAEMKPQIVATYLDHIEMMLE